MGRPIIKACVRPLAAAAVDLEISPETLRRWVRAGCPAVQGGHGRGKGSRIDVAAVRAWRDSKAVSGSEAQLREITRLALDFYRRGCEPDAAGQRVLGITNTKAAALLCFFLQYLAMRILKAEMSTPETEQLEAIAME